MTDSTTLAPRLARDVPAPPVRIVHLGLGAFARSHTAWYTARATDAADWGIAAYAGRSRALADTLAAQDGLYTLVERGATADRTEIVDSLARTHSGLDVASLLRDLAAATTALVTLTITESGYLLGPDGRLDRSHPDAIADLEVLRAVGSGRLDIEQALPVTAPARLVLGLELRRKGSGTPITLLSCDNLPDNGGALRRTVTALASALPGLTEWIDRTVSFASSSVDRITPRPSAADAAELEIALGDRAPVIAEPFADWVISGAFPAGRPLWEGAGARFVDDLEPWEAKKLWMLNGAHTLLACLGILRGHSTVAEAIADPVCRRAVEQLWDEASRHLPPDLELEVYRAALLDRFDNARIGHSLAQIADDTTTKLRVRIAPVAVSEREGLHEAAGCALAFAAWIAATRAGLVAGGASDRGTRDSIAQIDPRLAADDGFVQLVDRAIHDLTAHPYPTPRTRMR